MAESNAQLIARVQAEIAEAELEREVAKRLAAVEAERTAREAAAAARPRKSRMSPKDISDFLTKYGSAEFAKLPR